MAEGGGGEGSARSGFFSIRGGDRDIEVVVGGQPELVFEECSVHIEQGG